MKQHTLEDLKLFKARGFTAAEIDNLDRPLDDVQTKAFDRASVGLTGRLGFYRTYADEYVGGNDTDANPEEHQSSGIRPDRRQAWQARGR